MNCFIPTWRPLERVAYDILQTEDSFSDSAATALCEYPLENWLHHAAVPISYLLALPRQQFKQCAFKKNKEGLLLESHFFKTFPDQVELRASFPLLPRTWPTFHQTSNPKREAKAFLFYLAQVCLPTCLEKVQLKLEIISQI